MTIETIRSAIRRRPFLPFILKTADSRLIPVNHPEMIWAPGGRTIFVALDTERFEYLDLLLIVGLETAGAPATGQGGQAEAPEPVR